MIVPMRELHAVLELDDFNNFEMLRAMKRQVLFFDKLHILNKIPRELRARFEEDQPWADSINAELDFLREKGIIAECDTIYFAKIIHDLLKVDISANDIAEALWFGDSRSRLVALAMCAEGLDAISIRRFEWDNRFPAAVEAVLPKPAVQTVLSVAFSYFPAPNPESAWEDVLNFKAELAEKKWGFRRFLQSLASRQPRQAEIRDEIEWTLHEYRKSMRIHHLKADQSFLEVYVIPAMEVVEEIVKLNWSKIAKGTLSARKRQIELMEAEMKATGRECAYIFEAQQRFGPLR